MSQMGGYFGPADGTGGDMTLSKSVGRKKSLHLQPTTQDQLSLYKRSKSAHKKEGME